MKRYLLLGLCTLLVIIVSSLLTSRAQGPTATTGVTTLAPTPSALLIINTLADLDTGKCDAINCSLRDAIAVAPDGSAINFAPGLTGTIILDKGPTTLEGEITFTKNLIINGPGPKSDAITIDGQTHFPIFLIEGAVHVTINMLQMQNAHGVGGGAIDVRGANVLITQSTFLNNYATSGGAIGVDTGTVTIIGSTFEGNNATSGGAIFNWQGQVVVVNSTFQDNGRESTDAGAISNSSQMTITNSTLAGNGGVRQVIANTGQLAIQNSIFVNTLFPTKTCGSPITDRGNNLEYPIDSCKFTVNAIHADPKLDALRDNGGPSWTMALQPGSAALDAGDKQVCAASMPNHADQRGMVLSNDSPCDIGAFQHNGIAPTLPSP